MDIDAQIKLLKQNIDEIDSLVDLKGSEKENLYSKKKMIKASIHIKQIISGIERNA